MSLQTPQEVITSEISACAAALASHLENAIILANRMSAYLTNAPNNVLADWLNSRGARLTGDLEEFAVTGAALNTAAASVSRRTDLALPLVDVTGFSDKLLAKGRIATVTQTGWVVEDVPPPEVLPTIPDDSTPPEEPPPMIFPAPMPPFLDTPE